MYQPTDLSITGPQLLRLFKNQPVQLSKDALQNCNSRCYLHPQMAKVVEKARKTAKGCRIVMSQDEIMRTGPKGMSGNGNMSGMGFWSDSWDWLKKKIPAAFNWAKENVVPVVQSAINSDFYQQNIRPKAKDLIEGFAERNPYANVTVPAIEYLGDRTKAFGVKKARVCKPKPKGGSFKNPGY